VDSGRKRSTGTRRRPPPPATPPRGGKNGGHRVSVRRRHAQVDVTDLQEFIIFISSCTHHRKMCEMLLGYMNCIDGFFFPPGVLRVGNSESSSNGDHFLLDGMVDVSFTDRPSGRSTGGVRV